jgi:hypothetical protein
MEEFASSFPVSEIEHYVETTTNVNHLWVLLDYPSRSVSILISKNKVSSDTLLLTLGKKYLHSSILLESIFYNANCSEATKKYLVGAKRVLQGFLPNQGPFFKKEYRIR